MANIILTGIQIFCNREKREMLRKAEYYMDQAYRRCPNIDLFILPEQFYQLNQYPIDSEHYGEEPGGLDLL